MMSIHNALNYEFTNNTKRLARKNLTVERKLLCFWLSFRFFSISSTLASSICSIFSYYIYTQIHTCDFGEKITNGCGINDLRIAVGCFRGKFLALYANRKIYYYIFNVVVFLCALYVMKVVYAMTTEEEKGGHLLDGW